MNTRPQQACAAKTTNLEESTMTRRSASTHLHPPFHAASRQFVRHITVALVFAVAGGTIQAKAQAQAQALAQPTQPVLRPVRPGPAPIDLQTAIVRVDAIAAVSESWWTQRDDCPARRTAAPGRFNGAPGAGDRLLVFVRGKDPHLHLLRDDTALVLAGPFVDRITEVRLGALVGTIEHTGKPGANCGVDFAGDETGIAVVRFALPNADAAAMSELQLWGTPTTRSGVGRPIVCATSADGCAHQRLHALPVRLEPLPVVTSFAPDAFTTSANGGMDATLVLSGSRLGAAAVPPNHPQLPPCFVCFDTRSAAAGEVRVAVRSTTPSNIPPGNSALADFSLAVRLMRDGRMQWIDMRQTRREGQVPLFARQVTVRRPATAPPPPPAPPNPPTSGGNGNPNLLPQLLSTAPLLRNLNGVDEPIRVLDAFCSGVPLLRPTTVAVPPLVWGASATHQAATGVRVQLRNLQTGAVLSTFDTGQLERNGAAETRQNYPGRPTQVLVINLDEHVRPDFPDYEPVPGCYLHGKEAFSLTLDPPIGQLQIVVDPANAVDEGANGEADNALAF